jgi:DNA helicase-2/ATP-dependent DNA helicase PcrA
VYVRSGETVRPRQLPGRAELERLLTEEPQVQGETVEEPPNEHAPVGD